MAAADEPRTPARPDTGPAGVMRLAVRFAGVPAAAGHELELHADVRARVADTDADRKLFAEQLLARRDAARPNDVAAAVADRATPAVRAVAKSLDAAHVLTDGFNDLRAAVAEAIRRSAFGLGIEVLPPVELRVDSPTLRRQRLEDEARRQDQARHDRRAAELRRAVETLELFEQARAAAPDVPAGVLIDRLAPAARGDVVDALLRSAAPAGGFQVVSGDALCEVVDDALAAVRRLPADLGPARSVARIDGGTFAVGCRGGVWVRTGKPDGGDFSPLIADGQAGDSPHGFNGVCQLADGRFAATHAEIGLVVWPAHKAAEAGRRVFGPDQLGGPPRSPVALADGRVALLAGNRLMIYDGDGVTAGDVLPAAGVTLLRLDRRLAAVTAAGDVRLYDAASVELLDTRSAGVEVRGAAAVPFAGSARIALATSRGVEVLGPDDGLARRHACPGGTRAVAAAGPLLAGIGGDRQRVFVWTAADPDAPPQEVHVTSRTGHRAGDLCPAAG